jgi:serine phosphatase RsbU (regulator of sigma subunit)
MRFSFDTVKLFDEVERTFVLALAAQTAETLRRTEMYEAERQATVDLQRALLPPAVTGIHGWEVAAHYSPAGGSEIGGDFYDVVPVPDGRVAAIVGDVMGRGLQAAAAMAEVRSTIRAYIVDDPEPAAVFRRVDAFFNAFDRGQLVTALYFLVDHHSDIVQIANAGHLPPLLVEPGKASIAPTVVGLPFGAGGDERVRTTVSLHSGEAVVAITDGLVERRGEDIDVGISRLLDATAAARWTTARGLVRRMVEIASRRGMPDDDVTALVLRRE